ncbi:MAG: FeoB small GTPase domain-containing protein [Anaerolineae bacterium]
MAAQHTIALAGNPNTGKSTLFNALTGAHQHVGNWPGKTVEKREGIWQHNGQAYEVVDLPGTYSLTAYSLEEVIARDFIVDERPDVVVAVVDSANLERNLYLVVQILEMGAPVVVALNMSDIADSRGIKIDMPKLSQALGAPVVPIVASKGEGLSQLEKTIVDAIQAQEERARIVIFAFVCVRGVFPLVITHKSVTAGTGDVGRAHGKPKTG